MLRIAVIGMGSNSLRMLVADIDKETLNKVGRYRKGLRMFAALDENHFIVDEMIQIACVEVADYVQLAKLNGAEKIYLFATSAVRDAKNQVAFSKRIEEYTGVPLEVCDGEMEALLGFVGATSGGYEGMIDIGGGSTEIAIGQGTKLDYQRSLQLGAVRLFRAQPIVHAGDVENSWNVCKEIIKNEVDEITSHNVERWIGVGGTLTATAAFVKQLQDTERSKVDGLVLFQVDVLNAIKTLAPMSLEERKKLPYLHPQRADIVVHGIVILYSLMHHLSIKQIEVSCSGNLEGYAILKYLYNI